MVFPRTRDAFLKKLEAEAQLAEHQADREGIAVDRDRFELRKEQLDYFMQVADKFGDGEAKDLVLERLRTAMYDLATGDANEEEIRRRARKLLPQPGQRKKHESN